MMWVCRAGQKALYENIFIENSRIFLAWTGYLFDLHLLNDKQAIRMLVENETGSNNRTSISNWTGQLYSFAFEMRPDDYVLIPSNCSRTYTLAQIIGDYEFCTVDNCELHHSRKIMIISRGIPREIFDQGIIYSLGAYRTLFKVKNSNDVFTQISKWESRNNKDK